MGCVASTAYNKNRPIALSVESLSLPNPPPETYINPRKFTEVYKTGRILGSGTFGEVRLVVHRLTEQERAVKIYRKDSEDASNAAQIQAEIQILQKIDHPSVIKMYEYFEDDKRIYIVLEKCDGGDLFEQIFKKKYLSESIAAMIIKQLLSVVAYLHEKNVVHRDIKPENILLEDREDFLNIKIIDFGAAAFFSQGVNLIDMVGSAFYIAPEVTKYCYNEKCDEWSCGVILYILLSGSPPFPGKTNDEILVRVKKGNYKMEGPVWEAVSDEAKSLVYKLLCPAKVRLTALEAVKHPWIVSQGRYPSPKTLFLASTIESLKEFDGKNRLKNAINRFISTKIMSIHDTKELRELFKAIDTNGDGKLSFEEMKAGFSRVNNIDNSDEQISKIMMAVDTDKNGFIDYNEFLKATIDENAVHNNKSLKSAFDLFDLESKGKITSSDLDYVFSLGNIKEKAWKRAIMKVNKNFNGELDFEQFCKFMNEISKKAS